MTVTDPLGRAVAVAQTFGRSARVSWDGRQAPLSPAGVGQRVAWVPGTYRYVVEGNDTLGRQMVPVTGSLQVGAPDLVALAR